MLKYVLSLLIGVIFTYLSCRGVEISKLEYRQITVHWEFAPVFCLLIFGVPILKSLRLCVLYEHTARLTFKEAFSYINVGYLFITVLPLRLGEFTIPYLIRKHHLVPISQATAIILVERLVDMACLSACLFLGLSFGQFPEWLNKLKVILLLGLSGVLGLLLLLVLLPDFVKRVLGLFEKLLPVKIYTKLLNLVDKIHHGVQLLLNFKQFAKVILLTICTWGLSAFLLYLALQTFGIMVPVAGLILVFALNNLAVGLPAGPGMMGNFQYSLILSLSLFAVKPDISFMFAYCYYFALILFTLTIGYKYFHSSGLNLRVVWTDLKSLTSL